MRAVSDATIPDSHQVRSTPRSRALGLQVIRALLLLAVLLGTASAIEAQTITLAWDANTEPDVAGYEVSYGNQPGVYSTNVDIGNATSMPFTPTAGVVYYFAVRAYTSANPRLYSPFSAEATYGVPVNQPPVLTRPANQTSAENATVSLQLVASDPDGTALSYSATGLPAALTVNASTGLISGTLTYTSAGSYTVTATVSDGAVTDSKTFTWTVTNVNRPPVLTRPANQTSAENATVSLQLVASDPDGTALSYSATGLPAALTVNASTGLISGTLTYTSAGSYTVTATVSDGAVTDSKTFTWTVTNVNRPPVLTRPANQTSAENATVSLQLVASDPDGTALTYSATGLPAALTVNASTGLISGTLTYASAGSYTVTATVSDGAVTDSKTFTWTVTNVNRPPVLTRPANQTSAENATVSLQLVASDPDGTALSYSATGLPAALTVNAATGLLSGTLAAGSAGSYTVTTIVSDGAVTDSKTFTWTVTSANQPPVLTQPANQTNAENATVSLQLVASDPDATPLTYSATGLPAALTVNAATGLISGTLSYASAGSYTVTATVSDGALTDSRTFTWTVTNVNRPPVLTQPANQTSAEGAGVSLHLVASDPDGAALTYSATGLPAALTVNAATGLISGALSYTSAGSYTVTATASDGSLSDSRTFTWTVTSGNRPPVLTQPANQTNAENATVSLQLVASDPDGTPLTYSATGLPAALTVNPATGLISGTLSYASAGSYTVTATVSDGAVTDSRTFTWTVTNVNRPPVFTQPANQTSAEGASVSLQLVASDPDGTALTYSTTGLPAALTVNPTTGLIAGTLAAASAGSYTVTATASDGSLSDSRTFVWTVTNGNRPPTLTQPPDQTSAEGESASLQLVASDSDGTALTYSATGLPAALTVNPTTGLIAGTLAAASAGSYTVTATASDGSLSDSKTFTWTVTNGDRPPTLTQPPNQTSRVRTRVAFRLVASDPDNGKLTYSATGLPAKLAVNARTGMISGTLAATSAGSYTVTATASNGALSDSKTFTWTVTKMTVKPTSFRFNATKAGPNGKLTSVTPAQWLRIQAVKGLAWTAAADQPWLQVKKSRPGVGNGMFRVAIVNPDNVLGGSTDLTATITVTPQDPEVLPVSVPVSLTINQRQPGATDPFGQVDLPLEDATIQGSLTVSGWVLDAAGTARITVYRNCVTGDAPGACEPIVALSPGDDRCAFSGVSLGEAAIVPGARPDLEAAFPDGRAADQAGWGLQVLTNLLPRTASPEARAGGEGPLTLYVVATDDEGGRALLTRAATTEACASGTATITMANDTIAHPFGTIETPQNGATVSGAVPVAGWALTPDDGTGILIPPSGRTMVTFIDGAAVAPRVRYNQCRAAGSPQVPAGVLCDDDIANLFGTRTPDVPFLQRTANPSGFRNLDAGRGAIGVAQISTQTLVDGLHTITWSVTDSAGRTEAVGSRLVTVRNGEAEAPADAIPDGVAGTVTDGWDDAEDLAAADGSQVLVKARTGFDLRTPLAVVEPDAEGVRLIGIPPAGRLELAMGGAVAEAYLMANDTWRDLPVGSQLDPKTGVFTWAPPAGYLGTYAFVFVRGGASISVHVTIRPADTASPGGKN